MKAAGSYSAHVPGEAMRLQQQAAAIWRRERDAMQGLGLAPGQRVLDVGCGAGGLLRPLAAELAPVLAVGVDLDIQHLQVARASGEVARADGGALPFADASFDFVVLRLVLRHTPGRRSLVAEAARVVRPGGAVCVTDVDESATNFDPEPASWPALKSALIVSAQRRGGDPFVGRRARGMLLEAGLVSPRAVMMPMSTDDLPAPAFVEVMLAPRARSVDPDIMRPDLVAAAWADLRAWATQPGGFAFGVGITAAAKRPA